MGSNGKTRKTSIDVVKERGTSGSVAGSGTGQGKKSSPMDECLFTLTFKQKLPTGVVVNLGDLASIVPTGNSGIEVVIGSTPVGQYSGSKAKLLVNCIGKGFVYEGQVIGVNNSEAEIKVTGNG